VIPVTEKRIFFNAGGLKLEGMLADSPGDNGVVISHPHPLYGGTMQNNMSGPFLMLIRRRVTAP